MATRWTKEQEKMYSDQLYVLYHTKNLSLKEISSELNLSEKTIFKRMRRLGVKTNPSKKNKYLNKRTDLILPNKKTSALSEFFGIMLGDGHITEHQVTVTLGNKEKSYAQYVANLIKNIFQIPPKICLRKGKYQIVYFGSVDAVRWLKKEGLVHNKVKKQVGAPLWVFSNKNYIKSFLRGFFDTDGSIYKLRYGIQLAFSNRSRPLLVAE